MDYLDDDCSGGSDEEESPGIDFSVSAPEGNDADYEQYSFQVIPRNQVLNFMEDLMRNISGVITELPMPSLRLLLNHFRWDEQELIGKYYDSDQQKLFTDAGIVPSSNKCIDVKQRIFQSGCREEDCEICFEKSRLKYMLVCGHKFCGECWTAYVTSQIMNENLGMNIKCAAPKCEVLMDDAMIMNLITDATVRMKYQRAVVEDFVSAHRLLRWCPAPGCTNLVKVQRYESGSITCSCLYSFCFLCGEIGHVPVLNCNQLKKWIHKIEEEMDADTMRWISRNTKECPHCNVFIEKNGGCNHMLCKNRSCKYEFCWLCLTNWSDHHNCNVYNDGDQERRSASNSGRYGAAVERYLHLCERYINHKKSLKLERELHVSMLRKTHPIFEAKPNTVVEGLDFLVKAVDILCQCRQTLMHTYVFADFISENNQSIIFEVNQTDLEIATESLSARLEHKLGSVDFINEKSKIISSYEYCNSRRKVLVKHIWEGYEKDWWSLTE